ncbi:MAG: hypothetical protein EXS05_11840 [Planctomycetaceae bacterium]|nr:hypothetical protein [Planctomycetaceae bacterium]
MHVRSPRFRLTVRSGALTVCAAVAMTLTLTAAAKRPLKKLTYDPTAASVELFDGIEQGTLESTVIMKGPFGGTVFLENKSDQPLTVKLPKAVAAVQVFKQGFGQGPGGGGGIGGGQQGGGGQGGGGGQSGGGGMGGGGMGGGGMGGGGMQGGGGGGFFSIPPEKTVQLPLTTVCLNHGKPDPRPHLTYKLVPIEVYTNDPVLQELVTMVGTGKLDRSSAQAAAWHLTDNMSWDQLAAKKIRHVGGVPPEPYFQHNQLAAARQLVSRAQERAKERETETKDDSPKPANRRSEKKI